jgi:hypothetical protein
VRGGAFKALTKLVFNPGPLLSAKDRAEMALLRKVGAYVRRAAKSSLRYRKKSAPPGIPPFVHRSDSYTRLKKNRRTGQMTRQAVSPLRELIFFAVDMYDRAVYIGPKLGGSRTGAPRRLEKGGVGTIGYMKQRRGIWAARPYMDPALRSVLPQALQWVKGMVR